MREDKYYGTNAFLNVNDDFKKRYGVNHHRQYRIVCKAKSMAEANRKADSLGLGNKTFSSAYTSETGNDTEIRMCDQYGFIICTRKNGTIGNDEDYVSITEALKCE